MTIFRLKRIINQLNNKLKIKAYKILVGENEIDLYYLDDVTGREEMFTLKDTYKKKH